MTAKKKSNAGGRKWSAGVTKHSDALDLEKGVFTSGNPEKVARSLERSATTSRRKKGTAYQSAMSMLNFYINRAGKNLPVSKKKILEKAKDILREDHAKEQAKTPAKKSAPRAKKTRPHKSAPRAKRTETHKKVK